MGNPQRVILVIIFSRMHLNNALSWLQDHANLPAVAVVFRKVGRSGLTEQDFAQCGYPFAQVHYVNSSQVTVLERIRQMARVIRQVNTRPVEAIAYAIYDSWETQLIKDNISHQQEVVLDDGLASMTSYRRFWEKGDSHPMRLSRQQWYKMACLALLHRLQPPVRFTIPEKTCIYTRFGFDDPRVVVQQIEPASPDYHPQYDKALIVGQPFVNNQVISAQTYYGYLARLVRCNPGVTFHYKPHPAEHAQDQQQLQQIGVILVDAPGTSEDYFLAQQMGICVGFVSTVFLNLKQRAPRAWLALLDASEEEWLKPISHYTLMREYLQDAGLRILSGTDMHLDAPVVERVAEKKRPADAGQTEG